MARKILEEAKEGMVAISLEVEVCLAAMKPNACSFILAQVEKTALS